MQADIVIKKLQELYPGKSIVKNNDLHPTEIICEIEPASAHPDYSIAIVVLDKSIPHVHQVTTELYEVLKGELTVTVNNRDHVLQEGDKLTILPGEFHFARGNETWFKTTSSPAWTLGDHIIPKVTKQTPSELH